MAKPAPQKRPLKFNSFDDMVSEARSLMENGYASNGNWSLGQACGHLAEWMRYSLDGYPRPPLPLRAIFWVMKHTIAPRMKRKILAEGFQGGLPTAPESVPRPDSITDQQGLAQLLACVERVTEFDGKLLPSPLFGPMDKEMHTRVTLLHAEHHLAYFEPK
ncbi:MAG: DUF1569 domain-containing protein [Planctomycetota bacterium]|nr:DUF1569 domain-containing protein [Planctomycetota bacterium]